MRAYVRVRYASNGYDRCYDNELVRCKLALRTINRKVKYGTF